MDIYLFPRYVNLESVSVQSPRLFELLAQRKLDVKAARWTGIVASLPHQPSIIRASSMMHCEWPQLARFCATFGHLCFYEDQVLLPNGELSSEELIPEATRWLDMYAR